MAVQDMFGDVFAIEGARILREEMDARGWHNNDYRAGLAAIVGGESHFTPSRETGWSRTSNDRIRQFFSRARSLSDSELNRIKATDQSWFNFVYGGRGGNSGLNDGYIFRGGGLNQLTFLDNYALFGPKVGVDLVNHPELILAPRIAAAVAVEYMKTNFHGGDFAAQKRAVGVSMGGPDETKNQLYAEYTESGVWNYDPARSPATPPAPPAPPPALDPAMAEFFAAYDKAAAFLKAAGLYTGPIGDHDPGPGFRAGVKAYLKTK
jgi:predicted chitinase